MKKGKRICDTLKAIRQLIAKENGIVYKPRECNFTGDCSGTCPACEAEMKYLEQQLIQRKKVRPAPKTNWNSHNIMCLSTCICTIPRQHNT